MGLWTSYWMYPLQDYFRLSASWIWSPCVWFVIFNCCVGLVYSLSCTDLPHPAIVIEVGLLICLLKKRSTHTSKYANDLNVVLSRMHINKNSNDFFSVILIISNIRRIFEKKKHYFSSRIVTKHNLRRMKY